MTEEQQPITSPTPVSGRVSSAGQLATSGEPVVATKGPAVTPVTDYKGKQPRKIFGVDIRSALTVVGLTLFFVLAMIGVLIALRQRQAPDETTAPTAPQSQPQAAIEDRGTCAVGFNVSAPPIANCLSAAFEDTFNAATLSARYIQGGRGQVSVDNGVVTLTLPTATSGPSDFYNSRTILETKDKVSGDFMTEVDVTSIITSTTPAEVQFNFDTLENGGVAISWRKELNQRTIIYTRTIGGTDNVTDTVTGEAREATVSGVPATLKFRIERENNQITSAYDIGQGFVNLGTFTNLTQPALLRLSVISTTDPDTDGPVSASFDNLSLVCPVVPSPTPGVTPTPTPTPTPSPTPSPTPTPIYSCNSACTSNAECQAVNSNYICATVSGTLRCRLESNISSTSCTVAVASPTPSPTPTVGCNQTCVTNADCSNADHICYGSVCRLATNPENSACVLAPSPIPTPTPGSTPIVQVPEQPELPPELPQSGAEDLTRWLVPGIGALLLGALALFFL